MKTGKELVEEYMETHQITDGMLDNYAIREGYANNAYNFDNPPAYAFSEFEKAWIELKIKSKELFRAKLNNSPSPKLNPMVNYDSGRNADAEDFNNELP
jgi:hypothetical protein